MAAVGKVLVPVLGKHTGQAIHDLREVRHIDVDGLPCEGMGDIGSNKGLDYSHASPILKPLSALFQFCEVFHIALGVLQGQILAVITDKGIGSLNLLTFLLILMETRQKPFPLKQCHTALFWGKQTPYTIPIP